MKTIRMPSTRFEVIKEALKEKCEQGISKLFQGLLDEKHAEYLVREVKYLYKAPEDWTTYLMIASAIAEHVKKTVPNGIGPGKGIICSSLIAYLLGITSIDPVEYDLCLERFYGSSNTNPVPSICFDMSINAKKVAIEFLQQEFGADCVWAPTAILRNQKRAPHITTVIVSDKPMKEYTEPTIYKISKISLPVGMMSHNEADDACLLSFDFIHNAYMDSIETMADVSGINTWKIPSPQTLTGQQFKTLMVTDNLLKLDENCTACLWNSVLTRFNDSIQDLALGNVGMLIGNKGDLGIIDLLERKESYKASSLMREVGHAGHEFLRDILEPTYGGFYYQEQTIATLSKILGIDGIRADVLRRDIGKKKMDKVRVAFTEFVARLSDKEMNPDEITDIWNQIFHTSMYVVTKAHAIAVATLQYWYAYCRSEYNKTKREEE